VTLRLSCWSIPGEPAGRARQGIVGGDEEANRASTYGPSASPAWQSGGCPDDIVFLDRIPKPSLGRFSTKELPHPIASAHEALP
jgi:hypothetical protein